MTNAVNGCWSHNGRYLVYRVGDSTELMVFDSATNTTINLGGADGKWGVSCFSPDDEYIVTTQTTPIQKNIF